MIRHIMGNWTFCQKMTQKWFRESTFSSWAAVDAAAGGLRHPVQTTELNGDSRRLIFSPCTFQREITPLMSQRFMISSPFANGGTEKWASFRRWRCHGSCAYQVWAGFSEAADQFRGPTNLWAGNRNEQIHFQVGEKKHRVKPFFFLFYFPDMWNVTSSTSGCCHFADKDIRKCCAASPWSQKKRQITFQAC